MHIHHDSILTLDLPYRERLALRRTVFHGGDGPKVAVLAGVSSSAMPGKLMVALISSFAWRK